MERARATGEPGHLHHADLERAAARGVARRWVGEVGGLRGVVGLVGLTQGGGALESEQALERGGGGDLEIVSGEDADGRAARQGGAERRLDTREPGVLDEGRHDGDVVGQREQREHLRGQAVGLAAGGECAGAQHLGERTRGRRCRAGEIVATPRDDVADAAARVGHVAGVARDHVEVQVHHGLPGGLAGVEAHVVAIGPRLTAIELGLHHVHQRQQLTPLVLAGLEPIAHRRAPRDDERVTRRHGVAVAHGEGVGVGGDPAGLGEVGEDGHGVDLGGGVASRGWRTPGAAGGLWSVVDD